MINSKYNYSFKIEKNEKKKTEWKDEHKIVLKYYQQNVFRNYIFNIDVEEC